MCVCMCVCAGARVCVCVFVCGAQHTTGDRDKKSMMYLIYFNVSCHSVYLYIICGTERRLFLEYFPASLHFQDDVIHAALNILA